MTRRLLIPIFLLATATAAAAQTAATTSTPTAQDQAASDCARARKMHRTCVLTIEAENVNGKNATGDGTIVSVPTHGKQASLIRLREDFRAEIIRSAENF